MQTIVFTKNDSSAGLIVERITDIVEESITLLRGANRKGSDMNPCCARYDNWTFDVKNIARAAASPSPSFLIEINL